MRYQIVCTGNNVFTKGLVFNVVAENETSYLVCWLCDSKSRMTLSKNSRFYKKVKK